MDLKYTIQDLTPITRQYMQVEKESDKQIFEADMKMVVSKIIPRE